jgi:hypothetical protein
MLGKDETVRFLDLSLFQGLPIKKGIKTIVSWFRGGAVREVDEPARKRV